MKKIFGAIVALLLALHAGATDTQIDFTDAPLSTDSADQLTYTEDGLTFTIRQVQANGSESSGSQAALRILPRNGTSPAALAFKNPLKGSALASLAEGAYFKVTLKPGTPPITVISIDLQNLAFIQSAVRITGYKVDGSTISQDAMLGSNSGDTLFLRGFDEIIGFSVTPRDGSSSKHRFAVDNVRLAGAIVAPALARPLPTETTAVSANRPTVKKPSATPDAKSSAAAEQTAFGLVGFSTLAILLLRRTA